MLNRKLTAIAFLFLIAFIPLIVQPVSSTSPPTYSNTGQTSTVAGSQTTIYSYWNDATSLSGYIASTNNTGTWTNQSWAAFSGTPGWANFTFTVNSTIGDTIQWIIYANDSSNNWNSTITMTQSTPVRVQGNAKGTTTGSSITVTLTSTPINGDVIVLTFGDSNLTYSTISSITETGVNWSTALGNPQVQSEKSLGHIDTEIWIGLVNSTTASKTITVTLAGKATLGATADVCEYSGINTTVFLDKTATASGGSTTLLTGTTSATAQTNELWVGDIGVQQYAQSSPTNSFTLLDGTVSNSFSEAYLEHIVNATGTAGSGTTISNSMSYAGCIATFEASSSLSGNSFTATSSYVTLSRVQGNAQGTTTTSSMTVTLNLAPTSGNALILTYGSVSTTFCTISSIAEDGVTWAGIGNPQSQSESGKTGHIDTEIWVGLVGTGASSTIALTLSGTPTLGAVADVCEYSGLATAGFLDQAANAWGGSANPVTGTTSTTSQASELWIGSIVTSTYNQTTPANGFALLDGVLANSVSEAYLELITASTGAAVSGTTISTSNSYAGCIATFRASSINVNSTFYFQPIISSVGCTIYNASYNDLNYTLSFIGGGNITISAPTTGFPNSLYYVTVNGFLWINWSYTLSSNSYLLISIPCGSAIFMYFAPQQVTGGGGGNNPPSGQGGTITIGNYTVSVPPLTAATLPYYATFGAVLLGVIWLLASTSGRRNKKDWHGPNMLAPKKIHTNRDRHYARKSSGPSLVAETLFIVGLFAQCFLILFLYPVVPPIPLLIGSIVVIAIEIIGISQYRKHLR